MEYFSIKPAASLIQSIITCACAKEGESDIVKIQWIFLRQVAASQYSCLTNVKTVTHSCLCDDTHYTSLLKHRPASTAD